MDTLNTNILGDHIISYDVSDSEGNSDTQLLRTVTVRTTIVESYTNFFNGVNDILDSIRNYANNKYLKYWVDEVELNQSHGTILNSSSHYYDEDDLTSGGLNNFITKLMNRFTESSGLRNAAILLLVQMAEYTDYTSRQDLIMNILTGVSPYTGKVEYGVTDDQISHIKTNYEQDAQSIIG